MSGRIPIKRLIVALILVLAACGGDGSTETPSGSDDGQDVVNEEQGTSDSGGDSDGADSGSEATSDGTRILVATGTGINVVDLVAESQEPLAEGYENPFGLAVHDGDLWFADSQNSLVAVDARSGDEQGTVALPGQFSGLAVTDEMAWTIAGLIGVDAQLVGIDREGMTIRGSALPPENTYFDLVAASGDSVWVHGGDIESVTSVSKVDPATVTVGDPVDSGVIADSMVVGLGSLWVGGTKPASADGATPPLSAIAKLDPSTGEVLDVIEIGGHGDGEVIVDVAFDHLWATQGLDGVLIKFDPASGAEVDRVGVGAGAAGIPYPILSTGDRIWVVNSTDDQALSFDPDTLEPDSGITLPTFSGAFAFAP